MAIDDRDALHDSVISYATIYIYIYIFLFLSFFGVNCPIGPSALCKVFLVLRKI